MTPSSSPEDTAHRARVVLQRNGETVGEKAVIPLSFKPLSFGFLGGFAKVKLAQHLLTGEKVAIKIMDKLALGVSRKILASWKRFLLLLWSSQEHGGATCRNAACLSC